VILQSKAADQWAYYQAKKVRLHQMKAEAKNLTIFAVVDKAEAAADREEYLKEADRYAKETEEIGEQARDLEKERDLAGKKEDRFDAGEVILEIALIICSLTLLTKKTLFWISGIALGILGFCVTVSGFLIR
jgi:Flp pilus assembly protein TadB